MINSNKTFDVTRAWGVLEQMGSGDFNVVADYIYRSLQQFYNSSAEFVRSKKKYKKALEKLYGERLL